MCVFAVNMNLSLPVLRNEDKIIEIYINEMKLRQILNINFNDVSVG